MAKKKTIKAETVVEKPATVEAQVPATEPVEEKPELVMEANFVEEKTEEKPVEKKQEVAYSSTTVLTNCTQNIICISDGHNSITVQPREMKIVQKDVLREIMKQEMVRRYFDKGLLSSQLDAEEKSASEAEVPEGLKGAVERHQDGSTVSASVKKFEKQGSVSLDLI